MEPTITTEGILHLDLAGIIDNISGDERKSIVRRLVLSEEFIDDIVSCIVNGRTDDAEWWWGDHLIRVKMKLLPLFHALEQETVNHFKELMERAEKSRSEAWTKQWDAEWKLSEADAEIRRLNRQIQDMARIEHGETPTTTTEE